MNDRTTTHQSASGTRQAANPKELGRVTMVLALIAMVRCAWRVLTPGGEWPLPPVHYYAMGLDALMLCGLFVLATWPVKEDQETKGFQVLVRMVLWCGIAASTILLALRFTSKAAWWTGHLYNQWG